ncbi:hypothetical protein DFJ63DRAFT_250499 [Scheffersomyces coipomensis]|uniref:uncharacterized protein n=1 Tax=Scheffersomyces coipomensis TaxID=1788519 RepID=UPI00315C550F
MVVSTRVSLQWGSEEPEELSYTMAFTSPQNHYVDIRIFKHKNPYKGDGSDSFDQVFQWLLAGIEEPIPDTGKINFKNYIDSQAVTRSIKSGKPLVIGSDIGDFSDIEGSLDRKEVGAMLNPDTGVEQSYIEIWRSLDPTKLTPTNEVRESEVEDDTIPVFTLQVEESDDIRGKIIRLGNWVQGITFDKSTNTFNVIRSFLNEGKWENQIEYGDISLFPLEFKGKVNDKVKTSNPAIVWKCLEIDNI